MTNVEKILEHIDELSAKELNDILVQAARDSGMTVVDDEKTINRLVKLGHPNMITIDELLKSFKEENFK